MHKVKIAKILKLLFFILSVVGVSACITEYNVTTKKQETLIYDTDKEIKIGDSVALKLESKYKVVEDVDVNQRIERILGRIVEVCDRKNLVYFIKVLEGDEINAVSLPGGYIYIFKGLIDFVDNDDQLAGVIAHEVGHIAAKHGIKRLQNMYGAIFLQVLAQSTGNVAGGVNLAINSLFFAYSQEDEFLADKLAVKYMKRAEFNPSEMIVFFKKLKNDNARSSIKRFSYWRTHPYLSKRIAAAKQEITGKLEFRDYLQLTEEKY